MNGKVCVVTGATSGIGLEVACSLATLGARVIGVGRDPGRCAQAASRLRSSSAGGDVECEVADLSSQAEVRALAQRIVTQKAQIDVLINNAGLFTWKRKESIDGIELHFAVNYLAAYLLTGLLLPHLATGARIITVSSASHTFGRIHWRNVEMRHGYNGLSAYARSKLAALLFTHELARRLSSHPATSREASITVFAADPGLVNTQIGEKETGLLVRRFWHWRARHGISPAQSAASIAFLASNPLIGGQTGRYWYMDEPKPSSKRSYDEGAARRLWDLSERMSGLRYLSDRSPGRSGRLTA